MFRVASPDNYASCVRVVPVLFPPRSIFLPAQPNAPPQGASHVEQWLAAPTSQGTWGYSTSAWLEKPKDLELCQCPGVWRITQCIQFHEKLIDAEDIYFSKTKKAKVMTG